MIYFSKEYSSNAKGSVIRNVRCEKCHAEYVYQITRFATGEGTSVYLLDNTGAQQRAVNSANQRLERELNAAIDPVSCPSCGHFQSDMVIEARRRRWPLLSLPVVFLVLAAYSFIALLLIIINNWDSEIYGPRMPWNIVYPTLGFVWLMVATIPFVRTLLVRNYDPNHDSPSALARKGYPAGIPRADFEKKLLELSKQKSISGN